MKLPVPQRGQPLDVSFIYKIVESINALWDAVVINVSAYASLWTRDGIKAKKASEIKVITGQVQIGKQSVKADTYKDFSYTFDIPFAYPPIVTATPIATEETDAAKNAYVVLTYVSENQVKGFVKFELKGSVNIGVNIIAIGVPV